MSKLPLTRGTPGALAPTQCPVCEHPHTCPCDSCQSRAATDRPWVYKTYTGVRMSEGLTFQTICCGNCGLEQTDDWWAEQEIDQHERNMGYCKGEYFLDYLKEED